jgi:hypothetical protein
MINLKKAARAYKAPALRGQKGYNKKLGGVAMNTVYRGRNMEIMAGTKYMYFIPLMGKAKKVPIDEAFNKNTNWNGPWNSECSYVEYFVNYLIKERGILVDYRKEYMI